MLWDVAGESKNYNVLAGHKNAVLEVKWSSASNTIVSCSADKTVGERKRLALSDFCIYFDVEGKR